MSDRLPQLQKLHDLDPKDPFLTYAIALEHTKADDPAEAIIWLDKTLELNPDEFYAYFQKAKALADLGETPAAIEAATSGRNRAAKAQDEKAASELNELLHMLTTDLD
ncbi:MAG: hypothetical protein RIG82_02880 [Phycisphaeraceae bacterium]